MGERIVGRNPLVMTRQAQWGECDPAGVVYTPVFSEYVLSAADTFYGELLGDTALNVKRRLGFGTPSRALSIDFRGSLRPDDEFLMTVDVLDIRTRTYVLQIDARDQAGAPIFTATLTPVCVALDERRSIGIPEAFRDALEGYRRSYSKDNAA